MFADFMTRAVMQGIPLLYGSTGEILTEKSGHLNLGIPGIMYGGAMSGFIGAFIYENNTTDFRGWKAMLITVGFSILGSLLMGLIYCFLTVTLRANQNVAGLALTTFGVGFGNFFGGSLVRLSGSENASLRMIKTSEVFKRKPPIEWLPPVLSYGFFTYFAIIVAIVMAFVLRRTRIGLHLRAVGENPATADAAGINVNRYKYVATCVGSIIAGLGGLYYVMDYLEGSWSNDAFGDRGWLAIALVIFAIWRPLIAVFGSILFGGLCICHLYVSEISFIPKLSLAAQELIKMTPYVVTIIILILISLRRKRETQPPAHLGLPYFREER
jgi:Uncharacterized ABC-type transport system, permease component